MKKRTRWFQFRMGTLILLVTLCAAGLGWFGVKVKNARRVANVVEEIHELGGSVRLDYELDRANVTYGVDGWPQWPASEPPPPPAPRWLRRWFGDYLFCDVVAVYFYWPQEPPSRGGGAMATEASLEALKSEGERGRFDGDADLSFVARLPQLEWLHLEDDSLSDAELAQLMPARRLRGLVIDSHRISDAGLKHLGQLTGLETLRINHSNFGWGSPSPYPAGEFSDAGLMHLRGLTNLRFLAVYDANLTGEAWDHLRPLRELRVVQGLPVDDEGLQALSGLPELRELSAAGVSDDGLRHLRRLTKLERLCLTDSRVTDAGLANLAANPSLDTLLLRNASVTDEGMVHVAALSGLEILDLSGTEVTDQGLARLANMPALRWLIVNDTQVTVTGLRQLQGMSRLERLCVNNIAAAERIELSRELGADVEGLGVGITSSTWNRPY